MCTVLYHTLFFFSYLHVSMSFSICCHGLVMCAVLSDISLHIYTFLCFFLFSYLNMDSSCVLILWVLPAYHWMPKESRIHNAGKRGQGDPDKSSQAGYRFLQYCCGSCCDSSMIPRSQGVITFRSGLYTGFWQKSTWNIHPDSSFQSGWRWAR